MPFHHLAELRHDLAPHYPALRALPNRRALAAAPLYAELRPELDRVLGGVERGDQVPLGLASAGRLRAVAWNIQRGARFTALAKQLAEDPLLKQADVLLLNEVDCGMARSGNRNIARELAERLGMSYAFGVSYLALEDDVGENPDGAPNSLALAGTAILARVPIGRVENVDLPELRDKFSSSEKRLGKKRALVAELLLESGPITVAACHLDSNASSAERARQLDAVLKAALRLGPPRILVGGDFNSTTYDLSSPLATAKSLLHKIFVTGLGAAIGHHLTPERIYERPTFERLSGRGFVVEGFNDRAQGTMFFDPEDPYTVAKLSQALGRPLTWLLRRLLASWLAPLGGRVPARLDWFAARGLAPALAAVADVGGLEGACSDHHAIVVDIAIGDVVIV